MDFKILKFYLGVVLITLTVIIVDWLLFLFLSQYMIIGSATDFYFAIQNYMWLLVPIIFGVIGVVCWADYIDKSFHSRR